MTNSSLIEPPASDDAPDTQPAVSHLPDHGEPLCELSPLLGFVPVAGPPAFVLASFGVVLLLLLVPPITLVATLMGVALVVAAALATLVVVAGAILRAPFLLVRYLRGHSLRQFSPPVPHVRKLNARRV
jgi:hypothetical protein